MEILYQNVSHVVLLISKFEEAMRIIVSSFLFKNKRIMKKIINLIFLILLFVINITAQPSLDIFKKYYPKWIHSTFDTTALDIVDYDDYTKLRLNSSIMKDGYVYNLYNYNLQNYSPDGGYIEKIDIETGDEIWKSFYDIRTIDINERPSRMRINQDGDLEIIGTRLLERSLNNNTTKYNTFVSRKYNSYNGELLSWKYGDPNDSLVALIHNYNKNIIYFQGQGQYQSLRPLPIYKALGADMKLKSQIIDKSGRLINEDSITFKDSLYHTIWAEDIFLINNDTFVTSLHYKKYDFDYDTILDFKYFVNLYDRELNKIKSLELTEDFSRARNFYELDIKYADNDYFIMRFFNEPEIFQGKYVNYYIYDYEGNILDSILLYNNNILFSSIKRIAKDEFLIIGTDSKVSTTEFDLHFYKKKLNSELILLKKIPMALKDRLVYIEDIHITENKDIIIIGGYHELNRQYNATFSLFPITICFSSADIDIVSNSKIIDKQDELIIYPNPVKDILTLEFPFYVAANIEIIDEMGRKIVIYEIQNNSSNKIDVSKLVSGIYFVNIVDSKNNRIIETSSFVKE